MSIRLVRRLLGESRVTAPHPEALPSRADYGAQRSRPDGTRRRFAPSLRVHLYYLSLVGVIGTSACNADAVPTGGSDPSTLEAVTYTPDPRMVTAVVAHIECSGQIVRAQVFFESPDGDRGQTPEVGGSSCPTDIEVLGLLPSTTYHLTTVASGRLIDQGLQLTGADFTTAPLPPGLPQPLVQRLGSARGGLTAFAAAAGTRPSYSLVVDSVGRIRWYHVDSSASDLELQPEPNGDYALTRTIPASGPEFDELDIAGNFRRSWVAVGSGVATDPHELRITNAGTGLLLGLETRTIDLSPYGGSTSAQVTANVLEEVDATGEALFVWHAFDHFAITDVDPSISLQTPTVDWNHGNAIEIDADGNYLVSFRHLSEITKIDAHTGATIWRWGGVRNEFQFLGDTVRFAFQHAIRRLANGHYVLFDNGNTRNPPYSRAVEYQLDQGAKTATLVWSYRPTPDIYSAFFGYVQRLDDGNTLVTFGPQGTLHEVSTSGQLVWKLELPQYDIYRARRIPSLYDASVVE